MTLGEKIIELRKKRGLSQEDLAITLGVSRQAVSKWETGESTPDTDKIVALADYFDVTTDWLLRDIAPESAYTGADAHMSPRQAQAGAPLLLCLTLGASAAGLVLLFYGKFIAPTSTPSLIGAIMQIFSVALSMGFGLFLKSNISSETGRHFLCGFWRVDIWLVTPLPLGTAAWFLIGQTLSHIPESVLYRLYATLPSPILGFCRLLPFGLIPVIYLAVCLLVSFRCCREKKEKN